MLLMLIGLGVVEIFQPGRYLRAFESLFSSKERDSIFVGSGNDRRPRWILVAVGVAMMGLGLQWYYAPEGTFPILSFLGYLGLSVAFVLVKFLMEGWVGITFFSRGEAETYLRHYRYLSDCLTVLSWPLLLAGLFVPAVPHTLITTLFCILLGSYGLLVLYKQIACFRLVPASLLYIPLYFLTTEILPAVALFVLAGLLIER